MFYDCWEWVFEKCFGDKLVIYLLMDEDFYDLIEDDLLKD